jgi:Putative Flp pilus-assembly TadE/G-like
MKQTSMNTNSIKKGERGQIIPILALSMTLLLGLDALVVDFGLVYFSQNELNASTQAAALAGAEAMGLPGATTTTATTAATKFSGLSGDDNAYANETGVSMVSGYPKYSCLTTLQTAFGLQCIGPSSTNAIVVKQQVSIPMLFTRLFGTNAVTLTSTATASMRGASAGPFNVAIIVDATRSMTDTDSSSNCKSTRISCALAGVQVLLQNLSPCQWNETTCGSATSGMVSNSVDRVSLYTFPAVTTGSVANEYNCSGLTPSTAAYSGSSLTTPPWMLPATSTYQVVNFSSDYRASDATSTLSTSSNIVKAVGGKSGCSGLNPQGGFGTYYAQVITAAQAALVAEQSSYPNSQNVIVLLSDGDATASCAISLLGVCVTGDMPGASVTSGTYMSTLQECHQAITAAQLAVSAGTRIYSVAYGAEASGCASDTNPTITPCQTMQKIASSPGYFFSDYTATGGDSTCIAASQPATNLSQIFQVIAGDLTVAKLIPNGTT